MKRKFVYLLVFFSIIFAINCYSADNPSKCFNRAANLDLPFEIFHNKEDYRSSSYYMYHIRPYGLSTNGVPFIKTASEVNVAPLCNGNFVAVWEFTDVHHLIPLTGRIFDSKFKTVFADFPISEKSETEDWEHSVSTLYDDGFVVTWKTWKTRARREIILRGRIFDNAGKPKGKSFDIYSIGSNGGCIVFGLPKGGFAAIWRNIRRIGGSNKGAVMLRIFDEKGVPRTKGIVVQADPPDPEYENCLLSPRGGYISEKGNIKVFMTCESHDSARYYNVEGKPLTEVLTGMKIHSIE